MKEPKNESSHILLSTASRQRLKNAVRNGTLEEVTNEIKSLEPHAFHTKESLKERKYIKEPKVHYDI